MATPPSTYDSNTNLSLGQIPQVEDPELYRELLDLHNAIENLLTSSDAADAIFAAFIAKYRNTTVVDFAMSPYTVLVTDGLILTDTTLGDVTVVMHPVADGVGYQYEIKQELGSGETLIIGDNAAEPVDDDAGGLTIDLYEAVPVKNDGVKWWINN